MSNYSPQDFVVWTAPGTDLPNQPMTGTLSACQSACDASSSCLGFSRLKTTADGTQDSCWLKQTLSPPSAGQAYRTYVKGTAASPPPPQGTSGGVSSAPVGTPPPPSVPAQSTPPPAPVAPTPADSKTGMYVGIGFGVLCCCILVIIAIYFATKKKMPPA